MHKLTKPLAKVTARRQKIKVEFEKGIPVAVNGKRESPADLLKTLNKIGYKHGIGRIDIVESRFVGMKSRGVYETPGGSILLEAHRDLEAMTVGRDLIQLKNQLSLRWSQLAYNGFWYCEEMDALAAFLESSQQHVNGVVTLELDRGTVRPIGRTSPNSLYDEDIASMDDDGGAYDQQDASGFIKLQALPLRVAAKRQARLDAEAKASKRAAKKAGKKKVAAKKKAGAKKKASKRG